MTPPAPPRLATQLLRWRLPADAFEPVAGDLEEGYLERRATQGRISARWWYWREALAFATGRARHEASPDDAPRRAARHLMRTALGSAAQDLRFGVRILRRNPLFACAAIGVMALGVGATTTVFSVLRGVLITPLPYRDPGRLVVFRATAPGVPVTSKLTSPEFHALRARTDLFDSVAAIVEASASLTAADVMAPLNAAAASEEFLATLGVSAALGRAPRRGDAGARAAVAIGHDAWQRYFRGSPDVIGTDLEIDGRPAVVAGVLPRGFKVYLGPDVTLPPSLDLLYFRGRGYDDDPFRGNLVIARLREGVALETANAAVESMAADLAAGRPELYRTGPVRLSVARLATEVVSAARPALVAAAGAVLLVLVVTCTNLTNLLLARASTRTREIAVRLAIGARRRDIAGQLLAEGLVVGAAGAAAGYLAAYWCVGALLALAPADLPRREAITVDGGIALFAMAIALACAILVSLAPAWQAARVDPAARAGRSRADGSTRGLFVAAQLAFSVVLLVGAGLLAQAFVNIRSAPLGFDADSRASMFIALDGQRWNTGSFEEARERRRGFFERLTDEATGLPGVERAGVGFPVPLSGVVMSQRVSLGEGSQERDTDGFTALSGYLEALNVPLVAGRYFTRADNGRPVVIVNERLARELWPGTSAIGRPLTIVRSVSAPLPVEVVGVVADVRARSPREAALPQVWMSHAVRAYAQQNLVVRAADPLDAAGRIAGQVRQMGAGRPVRDVGRLDDLVAGASADTRFALFVLGVLSALALLLAAVGVYGVVAQSLARRTREIAVRLALGAAPRRIVAQVLGDSARWTIGGLAGGLAGAVLLGRYLESLLYQVEPRNMLAFGTASAVLAAVALTATLVPALRAGRVDPLPALRRE